MKFSNVVPTQTKEMKMHTVVDPIVLPRETVSPEKSLQIAVRTLEGADLIMTLNIQMMHEIMRATRGKDLEVDFIEVLPAACA